jgi:hypothetical protein
MARLPLAGALLAAAALVLTACGSGAPAAGGADATPQPRARPLVRREPVDADAARYVTGVTLPVDAGFTVKV